MRGLSSLPLDDDVVDRILTFLPNYSTLQATILASKAFHNVFKMYPTATIRAVSYNVVGPALPQAISVLRYSLPDSDSDGQTNLSMTPPPRPWEETDPVSPISNEECRALQRNAQVVNTLEDLFSSRHKDRASQTSILHSMESWRFRRAVYRLMLFAKAFPPDEYEDDFDSDEPPDANELLRVRVQRKKLLAKFTNSELREVNSVAIFLIEVAKWAHIADGLHYDGALGSGDLPLARGPTMILEAYQNKYVEDLVGECHDDQMPSMLAEYIFDPLSRIWRERNEKPPPSDTTHWNSILDTIHGGADMCHRCNVVRGFDLWNESNWGYLEGVSTSLNRNAIPQLVKGNFISNVLDGPNFRTRVMNVAYTKLLNEIYQVKTSAYDTWNKQDWLCEACIIEIIRSHLHLWYLERKRENGEQIPEDCWYGYDCRTQTHSMHHAARVNHLCAPTR
ncbi:hypothetical protein D9615_002789 [Tricholomella constricta]|uniref:F-box domain-containing protein n=1 Tax=Tricholomella constricta TaxID=117010 RepID=A0A8H5HG10_9AGAR|nr:hypothetical protein D9615_002789 [Tricholomella constricta]